MNPTDTNTSRGRVARVFEHAAHALLHNDAGIEAARELVHAEDGARIHAARDEALAYAPIDKTRARHAELASGWRSAGTEASRDLAGMLVQTSMELFLGREENVARGLKTLSGKRSDLVDDLIRLSLDPEGDQYLVVSRGLAALGDTEFADAAWELVHGIGGVPADAEAAPADPSVVNGVNLAAVARARVPPPRSSQLLLLQRLAVAKGLSPMVGDSRWLQKLPELADYLALRDKAEPLLKAAGFALDDRVIIQDPVVLDALPAAIEAIKRAGFSHAEQEQLLTDVMFWRLIPNDNTPNRKREHMAQEHVQILEMLAELSNSAAVDPKEALALARMIFGQTSPSDALDDQFLIHSFGPHLKAMHETSWDPPDKLQALHLMRGTQRGMSAPADHPSTDARIARFSEIVAGGGDFDDRWPVLLDAFAHLARFPGWSAWTTSSS